LHYEYSFSNKENIEMIKKLTRSNRKCNFYVWDKITDKVRVCNGFKEWSERSFDDLIAAKAQSPAPTVDQLQQQVRLLQGQISQLSERRPG
jgi:hypothetical protein